MTALAEPSYQRLVEQVPAVVIVFALGRDLAPVYVSPQTEQILGVPASEWLEPPHAALTRIHPDDRVHLQMKLAQQARGVASAPAEIRWKRPDGRELWLRDVSGVVMEDGHLQAMLVDITEAKRAEAERRRIAAELQLAQKLEAVGRLAAGVAHEINTPVQALGHTVAFLQEAFEDVLGLYDAVRAGETPDEQAVDLDYLRERVPAAFARAQKGVDRVAEIVRTMGEQTHPAAHAPADLNAVARAALALSGGEADLQPLPPLTCDAGAIEQVLVNLLRNARDAGGTITLRTRAAGDHVHVAVEDTGTGIPPHVAERVFDPFFTTKDVGHGTGQGLAIARAIVHRHGGTLTFDTSPAGTTFHVRLPTTAGPSAAPA